MAIRIRISLFYCIVLVHRNWRPRRDSAVSPTRAFRKSFSAYIILVLSRYYFRQQKRTFYRSFATSEDENNAPRVAIVSVKLPNITKNETKFYHIVTKMEQADLVTMPPRDEYVQIVRFVLSHEASLERLLGSFDLGDILPTHLLAKMQELENVFNVVDILKMLFL